MFNKKEAAKQITKNLSGPEQEAARQNAIFQMQELDACFSQVAVHANGVRMNASGNVMRLSFVERMPNNRTYGRGAVTMEMVNLKAMYDGLSNIFNPQKPQVETDSQAAKKPEPEPEPAVKVTAQTPMEATKAQVEDHLNRKKGPNNVHPTHQTEN